GQGKIDAANQIAHFIWNKGGKHTKLESLIDNEDFSEDCIEWLRQQKLEVRTPSNLKAYIENTLFPKLIGYIKEDTISERMCRNYMYSWGFKYDERRKGIFFDSHERPDVVAYRNKWLKRMFMYKKNMKDFVGENILHPKHLGRSIMVSAFLCPCYELLCLTDQQLYENPYIKDKETFVIRSVQDALIAKRMNLSSGGKQPMMRNGWFIDETRKKYVQPMVFPNDYQKEELRGKQKGLRQVLKERKLWSAEKVLLVCEKCSGKCTDNGPEKLNCCAQRIMSLQPNFLEQWSLLEEAVINAEHIFEHYPKFHCECNFIERYWGFMKQEARRLCNYNYKDLVNLVPEVLKSVPVTTIRKFSCKS
ncbi:2452_t:CDS:2, partial [Cetraspora pellucida]